MTEYHIRQVQGSDAEAIIGIFNYYIEHSFAAYPDHPIPIQAFDVMKNMVLNEGFFVAENGSGNVVGFAMLKHYQQMNSFAHCAEVSYFIDKSHTGKG
jgi:L-amino acid N-acyltransferase YncA